MTVYMRVSTLIVVYYYIIPSLLFLLLTSPWGENGPPDNCQRTVLSCRNGFAHRLIVRPIKYANLPSVLNPSNRYRFRAIFRIDYRRFSVETLPSCEYFPIVLQLTRTVGTSFPQQPTRIVGTSFPPKHQNENN